MGVYVLIHDFVMIDLTFMLLSASNRGKRKKSLVIMRYR